ncbi:MAG: helix-turn-helix transcriptional regulator [Chloroflexota bacterium]
MSEKTRFGDVLKEMRKRRGLSQRALAEVAGVHQTTIRNWENRSKPPNNRVPLKAIAARLRIDFADLCNSELPPPGLWLEQTQADAARMLQALEEYPGLARILRDKWPRLSQCAKKMIAMHAEFVVQNEHLTDS